MFGKKYCKAGHKMDPSWNRCPVCITPVAGWLVRVKDGRTQDIYNVRVGKNLIGKGEDCDIRLLYASAKRHHAIIVCEKGEFSIIVQGSGGVLSVNGREVANARIIDGDLIGLGDVELKFKAI